MHACIPVDESHGLICQTSQKPSISRHVERDDVEEYGLQPTSPTENNNRRWQTKPCKTARTNPNNNGCECDPASPSGKSPSVVCKNQNGIPWTHVKERSSNDQTTVDLKIATADSMNFSFRYDLYHGSTKIHQAKKYDSRDSSSVILGLSTLDPMPAPLDHQSGVKESPKNQKKLRSNKSDLDVDQAAVIAGDKNDAPSKVETAITANVGFMSPRKVETIVTYGKAASPVRRATIKQSPQHLEPESPGPVAKGVMRPPGPQPEQWSQASVPSETPQVHEEKHVVAVGGIQPAGHSDEPADERLANRQKLAAPKKASVEEIEEGEQSPDEEEEEGEAEQSPSEKPTAAEIERRMSSSTKVVPAEHEKLHKVKSGSAEWGESIMKAESMNTADIERIEKNLRSALQKLSKSKTNAERETLFHRRQHTEATTSTRRRFFFLRRQEESTFPLPPKFVVCVTCKNVAIRPLILPCKEMLCLNCVSETKSSTCPSCGVKLGSMNLSELAVTSATQKRFDKTVREYNGKVVDWEKTRERSSIHPLHLIKKMTGRASSIQIVEEREVPFASPANEPHRSPPEVESKRKRFRNFLARIIGRKRGQDE